MEENSAKTGECWAEHFYKDRRPDCNECGLMSSSDPSVCFQAVPGDEFGSCHSCGFYQSREPTYHFDCVSCDEGWEIDVIFDDCSGVCVPEGMAYRLISKDTCNYPCAHCGYPMHDQAMFTSYDGACAALSYTECFKGDGKYAGCSRCGFYESGVDAMNPDDCLSCPHGYEIEVVYDDCTGYCVKAGTAKKTLINSGCEMPCAACGGDFDGWKGTSELTGRISAWNGYTPNFAICPARTGVGGP